jgi:hypothetical protein
VSIKKFNEYIEVFLDNRNIFERRVVEDSMDSYNLHTLALVSKAYITRNTKVKEAVYEGVRNSPQYLLYVFNIEERETWNSLTFYERLGVKWVSVYRKVKVWTTTNYNKVKSFAYTTWLKVFPPKPIPQAEEAAPEPEAPIENNLYYLLKVFKHLAGADTEKYVKQPLEPTVVIEANIITHAPGKVVAALWKEEAEGVMDEVKIVSYNVVPGKNPYTDEYDDNAPELNIMDGMAR